MLDTNTVRYIMRRHPVVSKVALSKPLDSLHISCITEGELLFGLALQPQARYLDLQLQEFLKRVEILPWDRQTAAIYAQVRAGLHRAGKRLAPLDTLIAAHALGVAAVLVTSDKAFRHIPGLQIEDWAA